MGRQAELQRLVSLLERPPALGVVRGAPGSGRTSLLLALRKIALAEGWRVVAPPAVGADTDRDALVRTLREQVGLPETLVQAAGEARGERLLGRDADQATSTAAVPQAEGTLLAGLGTSRTLVLLDGYRAAPEVERWLLDGLLGQLRDRDAPVVLVLAGRERHVREAAERADESLDARLPTETEVRQYFKALGAFLHPPAKAEEVEMLADEAVANPHLISPLVRALSYARTDG